MALLCAGLAVWLGWHHPLSSVVALTATLALVLVTAARPLQWPLWLLALWPLAGLMPWTGWLVVEEFDLVLLAVATGVYLRLAWGWPQAGGATANLMPAPSSSPWSVLLWLPLLLSVLLGLQRGIADAGGFSAGWWQGYREPLNSVRLAKPFFEVLLLMPLWRAACLRDEAAARGAFLHGMLLLLVGVSVVVWWERLAFTGLLDFATDYRATGPFWEMHIGGAALDAALAIAVPFAAAALASTQARGPWGATAAVVTGLALYAALVTFSRIVYAAVPLGLFVWWALCARQGSASGSPSKPGLRAASALWWLVWLVGFSAAAWWCFPTSGYRGLLAILGAAVLVLPLAPWLRGLPVASRILGLGLGLVAAAGVGLAAWAVPKGAYLVYAACWAATAAGVAQALRSGMADAAPRQHAEAGSLAAICTLAAFVATLAAGVLVAAHWGGDEAWPPALAVVLMLALALLAGSARTLPAWPAGLQWQGPLMATLMAAAALVGVFNAGGYMGGRMAASTQDSQDRRGHWSRALALLSPTDWVVGKGLGRYWSNQSASGLPADQTGDYRFSAAGADGSEGAVVLTSGRHDLGSGEALRLSQRVGPPAPGPLTLQLRVRIERAVKLQAEVCEKHLLYPAGCASAELRVEAPFGQWQQVTLKLKGDVVGRGPGPVPRSRVFSLSLGNHLNRAEIDNLTLTDALGQEMLVNGSFERGLAHWYFSSDRYHMPWHAKNMVVHLIFEQGVWGLVAMAGVVLGALWRTSLGDARCHALAPALAAGIVGLLTVGLVDSLLDMPRVAFLILLLVMVSLSLRRGSRT